MSNNFTPGTFVAGLLILIGLKIVARTFGQPGQILHRPTRWLAAPVELERGVVLCGALLIIDGMLRWLF